jgi:Domain of unknown function (DUF4192)
MPHPPPGPASLLAALPAHLRRPPQQGDLILLGWSDMAPDHVAVARLDAIDSEPDEELDAVADLVADGAETAVAVFYAAGWDAATWRLAFIGACCYRYGLGLLDGIAVVGDRWRSIVCTDPTCCPAEGRPLPTPTEETP